MNRFVRLSQYSWVSSCAVGQCEMVPLAGPEMRLLCLLSLLNFKTNEMIVTVCLSSIQAGHLKFLVSQHEEVQMVVCQNSQLRKYPIQTEKCSQTYR